MQPEHAPTQRNEQPDVLLTLALPQTLEDDVLNVLVVHASQALGFMVMDAQGMGRHEHLGSAMEQILGRSRRRLVQVAMLQQDVAPLLSALRQALQNPAIRYWVTPLLAFGHLGAESPMANPTPAGVAQ
ncbi:DUF3240 family protein [Limnohabitans sp. DM1]|uniref:DUF3240 family protein n=1 Tax=Limnohabitans sp. DM1 TaxID=1597955 RepID=UPI000AD4DC88|nr:DUF3240 family protein [Limnohabitans sp. DM1]